MLDTKTQLELYVIYAPLGTLLIAVIAASVALWSLCAQKKLARGRAAIDFFLKTEMDSEMLRAFQEYRAAIKILQDTNPTMAEFQSTSEYRAIRTYLDINELMATAIFQKVFDMRVCYNFWSITLQTLQKDSRLVIDHARSEHDGDRRYDELIALNKLWSSPAECYQLWRR